MHIDYELTFLHNIRASPDVYIITSDQPYVQPLISIPSFTMLLWWVILTIDYKMTNKAKYSETQKMTTKQFDDDDGKNDYYHLTV